MESLAGPFVVAAVVLLLAGVRKLLDPASTRGALRAMGLPWRGPVVPLIALGEIATGVWAVVEGSRVSALLLAAWYLAFTGFVAVALRRDVPLASCGCLGRPDTPPTGAHLLLDGVFAAVALGVAVDPYGPLADVLADQPALGLPFAMWVALGVGASYVLLAVLPLTLSAAHLVRHRHPEAGLS